jgi:hypothetical protein
MKFPRCAKCHAALVQVDRAGRTRHEDESLWGGYRTWKPETWQARWRSYSHKAICAETHTCTCGDKHTTGLKTKHVPETALATYARESGAK